MNILRFSLPVIQMFGLVVVVVGCGTQAHDMHVLDHQAESHAAMVIRHQTQNNAYVTFPQSNTLVIESLVTELTPRVGLPEIAAGTNVQWIPHRSFPLAITRRVSASQHRPRIIPLVLSTFRPLAEAK